MKKYNNKNNDIANINSYGVDPNVNYCLSFDKEEYNNPLFKEILIQEVKRISMKKIVPIKDYYKGISLQELKLQLICVDSTLSRGTLALAEKYMIKNNLIDEQRKNFIIFEV